MILWVSARVTLEMIEIILWSDLEDVSGGDSWVICGVTLVVWVVDYEGVWGLTLGKWDFEGMSGDDFEFTGAWR